MHNFGFCDWGELTGKYKPRLWQIQRSLVLASETEYRGWYPCVSSHGGDSEVCEEGGGAIEGRIERGGGLVGGAYKGRPQEQLRGRGWVWSRRRASRTHSRTSSSEQSSWMALLWQKRKSNQFFGTQIITYSLHIKMQPSQNFTRCGLVEMGSCHQNW